MTQETTVSQTTVFVISVAAEMAGMHPQTLRQYDRLGLVTPVRTGGGGRRYTERDVELLREVQRLSQEEGVNLAGIKRVIELENQVEALRSRLAEVDAELQEAQAALLTAHDTAVASLRRDLVPLSQGALVVWRPPAR
ncbi:MAG: MerR family transcriptional regulator [Frankiales bacterium]|nr:MerR family transcriptional regulator [Frankiales bacterium]